MKRRQFIKQTSGSLLSLPLGSIVTTNTYAAKPIKLLYFERSSDFVHSSTIDLGHGESVTGRALRRMGREFGFEVDCTKDGTVFDGNLDQYAAFVFFTCGELEKEGGRFPSPPMTESGIRRFYSAIREGGKGFLGIHSAIDTWKTPGPHLEYQSYDQYTEYIKMIGGQFCLHGHQQETTMTIVDSSLPWLSKQGKSFRFLDEWYCVKNFASDLHVILVMETEGMNIEGVNSIYNRPPFPSTWARMEGKGRVAYTAVGHNNPSWDEKIVPGIVSDLIGFVTCRYEMDLTPNIDRVCPQCRILKRKTA